MHTKTYNFIDITGQTIHYWTFLKPLGGGKWLAKCQCGNEKEILSTNVKKGKSKSCGCRKGELLISSKGTHGLSKTPIYRTYRNMISRCSLECADSYHIYGARGISVCDRWKESFQNFYDDMGSGFQPGLSIDRIDVNGNYEKSNCKWSTTKEQARNTRKNKYLKFNGKIKTIIEWSELLGMNYSTIQSRLWLYKWSVEKTFTTPVNKRKRNKRSILS